MASSFPSSTSHLVENLSIISIDFFNKNISFPFVNRNENIPA